MGPLGIRTLKIYKEPMTKHLEPKRGAQSRELKVIEDPLTREDALSSCLLAFYRGNARSFQESN